MKKRLSIMLAVIFTISVMSASSSYAAGKEGFGTKVANFWKKLLEYPSRVLEESASVLADTTKNGITVVTNEVKRVTEVAAGDVAKTKELIIEPITETAETVVKVAEGVINIPYEAAKDKVEAIATESE